MKLEVEITERQHALLMKLDDAYGETAEEKMRTITLRFLQDKLEKSFKQEASTTGDQMV